MSKLCIVTYLQENEFFTAYIQDLCNSLNEVFNDFTCIVFTRSGNQLDTQSFQFKVKKIDVYGTKYRRLLHVLAREDFDYCLSIDNDTVSSVEILVNFISNVIDKNYDIGWGRIQAVPSKCIVSRLVAIDKLLSHNIIRPFLWKMSLGISIPGQCFVLKASTFRNKLLIKDTFLDDLALGLYVNSQIPTVKICYSKEILASEHPKETFVQLWKQRERWALGYTSVITGATTNRNRLLVIIHGFSYHCIWIIHWYLIFILFSNSVILPFVYSLFIAVAISRGKPNLLWYAFLYQFIFPIFHLRWMSTVLKNILTSKLKIGYYIQKKKNMEYNNHLK